MKRLQWLKRTAILADAQMVYLLSCGDAYLVIWFLLQDVAAQINDGGRVYISAHRPMDTAFLARFMRRSKGQVEKALDVFESMDLISRDEDGMITLLVWDDLQDFDRLERQRRQNRERQERYRRRHAVQGDGESKGEDVSVPAPSAAVCHYESLWGQVNPMAAERLADLESEWGTDALCAAMDIAHENGTNNIKYIQAVLTNSNGQPKRRENDHDRWAREVDQCLAELFPENRERRRECGEAAVCEGRAAAYDGGREPPAHRAAAYAV